MSVAGKLAGLGVLLVTSSCFAVTDLDRFDQRTRGNYSDLKVEWSGMDNHKAEPVEFRVVDATNVIQTRGIIKPLGDPHVTFFVPMGVPSQNGPFRFDFWSDHNKSGGYDFVAGGSKDHSWRIDLTDALVSTDDQYVITFQHNYSFTDIESPPEITIGQPVKLTLSDMGGFKGQRIEMRVADANSGHVVAFYRVPTLDGAPVTLEVEGMIEVGSRYTVTLYFDNGSGGGVRGYTQTIEAGANGLVLSGGTPEAAGFAEVADKNAIAAP